MGCSVTMPLPNQNHDHEPTLISKLRNAGYSVDARVIVVVVTEHRAFYVRELNEQEGRGVKRTKPTKYKGKHGCEGTRSKRIAGRVLAIGLRFLHLRSNWMHQLYPQRNRSARRRDTLIRCAYALVIIQRMDMLLPEDRIRWKEPFDTGKGSRGSPTIRGRDQRRSCIQRW